MTRTTLPRTAGALLLAAILFLPALATAHEPRLAPPEPRFSLTALWDLLAPLLPGGWQATTANAEGDNGWLIDPDGSPRPSTDNGWLIDPNG